MCVAMPGLEVGLYRCLSYPHPLPKLVSNIVGGGDGSPLTSFCHAVSKRGLDLGGWKGSLGASPPDQGVPFTMPTVLYNHHCARRTLPFKAKQVGAVVPPNHWLLTVRFKLASSECSPPSNV